MTDPQSGGSGSRSGSRKEGTRAERFIRREQPVTGYQKWWPSDPRERSEEPGFQLAAVQKEARERGLWTQRAMLAPERGTGKWEMTALGSGFRGPTLECR